MTLLEKVTKVARDYRAEAGKADVRARDHNEASASGYNRGRSSALSEVADTLEFLAAEARCVEEKGS